MKVFFGLMFFIHAAFAIGFILAGNTAAAHYATLMMGIIAILDNQREIKERLDK